MKKVKVLQYFWGKLDSGGAETFIVNVFSKMNKKIFDVDFLTYENKEYFYNKKIKEYGGKIVFLSEKESTFLLIRLLKRWINLYKLLKKENYEVFHCNCDFSLKFIELLIAKKAGVKKRICHSHNSFIDTTNIKGKISYIVHLLCRPLICKYATDFFACSDVAAKWLYGKYVKNDKIMIVNNGIDVDLFDYNISIRNMIREKKGIHKDTIVIGNIGRFTPVKNQKYIVDIIYEASKMGYNFSAILIGDGENRKSVEEYAKFKNVENKIIFTGITHNIREYLMAFDCFVMPSYYEGLPVSGIEAQASGLLCFFSDTITNELKITSNAYYLSIQDDSSNWVSEIVNKLANFERKSVKQEIISANYDICLIAKKIEKIYLNVQ